MSRKSPFKVERQIFLREHDGEYRLFGAKKDDPEEKEGIRLSYSDKFDLFFINNLTGEPQDSYGANWMMKQCCVMLHPDELDRLIEMLQFMRSHSGKRQE